MKRAIREKPFGRRYFITYITLLVHMLPDLAGRPETIHLIPRWRSIYYSFVFMFITLWPIFASKSFCISVSVKARLHRRFLSRQLDAIFVAAKLHQVSNMFKTPAISRRQIALKIAPGLDVRFRSCNLSATKIASSCRDKNRLCKRALNKAKRIY